MKVGLLGYGKTGQAVARVLAADPRLDLRWILRRQSAPGACMEDDPSVPVAGLDPSTLGDWLDEHPVEAIVDFSNAQALAMYAEEIRERRLTLVTAISAYAPEQVEVLKSLGQDIRVMSSPNITLGVNLLLLASRLVREVAPFADVEIIEQHFRDKPEVSGTALKLAHELGLGHEQVTSLRLGGIVGHHEVIFGFPHQTVRLVHESIRREAFGSGAAFALRELATCQPGFYTFEDLMRRKIRTQLQGESAAAS